LKRELLLYCLLVSIPAAESLSLFYSNVASPFQRLLRFARKDLPRSALYNLNPEMLA
jgi:hypothetical protein